jgi:hypothetical protein
LVRKKPFPLHIFILASDKKNHKGAETWMLAQRIGPLDTTKVEGLSHTSQVLEAATTEMEPHNL